MGTSNKSAANGSNGAGTEVNIDPATQLQEIQKLLFGQQIAQLESAISHLRKEMRQQFDSLEKAFNTQVDKLRKETARQLQDINQHFEHLNEQQSNRAAGIEDEADSLKQALNQFEAQTEAAHQSIEKQLAQECQLLRDDMAAQHAELSQGLQGNTEQLAHDKVDRELLAKLFDQLAHTIRN
ncbi:MAG: hypothetical protein R3183_10705 [Oleiphilaceae bacterium]|nr:hypothetical protein [Oleiphilaceae bacterium]